MVFLRYSTSLAIVCSLLSQSALAEPTALARQHVSLDGAWEIAFDAGNKGRAAKWHTRDVFQGLEKRAIQVPSCWEEIEKDYEGVATYGKTFEVSRDWKGQTVRLQFDAVNYIAEVWLSDHCVGRHEGGYGPFELVTGLLLTTTALAGYPAPHVKERLKKTSPGRICLLR